MTMARPPMEPRAAAPPVGTAEAEVPAPPVAPPVPALVGAAVVSLLPVGVVGVGAMTTSVKLAVEMVLTAVSVVRTAEVASTVEVAAAEVSAAEVSAAEVSAAEDSAAEEEDPDSGFSQSFSVAGRTSSKACHVSIS